MNEQPADNAAEDVVKVGGGAVVTRWLDHEIVEATYSGYISERLVEEGAERFWRLARPRMPRLVLIDGSQMTGYSIQLMHPSRRWLSDFKARGGEKVVVVTAMNLFHMLVSTLMFAVGAPLRIVGSRDAALTRLRATRTRRDS